MSIENSFLNPNFHWFTGVIEDIKDPLQMGRVRVRCYGYHTPDKTEDYGIPTSSLPWAHVMMPITSASMSGIGESPTGVLPGSWVVGFFRDGDVCQDPIILGTIPSRTPSQTDTKLGFCDPLGQHPRNPNEVDTPRGATSEYQESKSFIGKSELRNQTKVFKSATDNSPGGVPIAKPPNMAILKQENPDVSGKPAPFFDRKEFIQPKQEEVCQPTYPYCHTKEYGRGHIVEYDETPLFNRTLNMHPSGTFNEITHDGTNTTVVTGENFEVNFNGKNVNVKGDCNLTVDKDVRTLVRGDYYLEIEGNYHLSVTGNTFKKVGMSEFIEISKSKTEQIDITLNTVIGKNEQRLIKGANHNNSPAESYVLEVAKGGDISFGENLNTVITGKQDMTTIGTLNNTSGARTDVINGAFKIDGTAILDVDAAGKITIDTQNDMDLHTSSGTVDIDGSTAINLN
jgi:hypothetical protein